MKNEQMPWPGNAAMTSPGFDAQATRPEKPLGNGFGRVCEGRESRIFSVPSQP